MSMHYNTALVTGASSGIGAALAEALAAQGAALILVARSADKLDALAQDLRGKHDVRVETVVADLALAAPGQRIRQAVAALGLPVDLLLNNAGFGTVGEFALQDPQREQEEIRLNIGAVVDLAHAFLPDMLAAGHGAIVNIASAAAFQPMPQMSVYSATKSFVCQFSDSLWAEYRGRGIHVMAVCPGPVDTPFFDATGVHGLRASIPQSVMLSAQAVASATLHGLAHRRRQVVPGGINKTMSALGQLVPRSLVGIAMNRFMRR
jgi:short-subunit dehydrogenase